MVEAGRRKRKSGGGHAARRAVLDTVFVKASIWLGLLLIVPIGLRAPATAPSRAAPAPALAAASLPAPSAADIASAPDRLGAILGRQAPGDAFDMPDSGAQAAGVLQWCARRIAEREHISLADAGQTLSAALVDVHSAAGARVIAALEAPAEAQNEALRMQCASLLYAQAQP